VKVSRQKVIALAGLLVSAAGIYFGVAVAWDLPPFDESSADSSDRDTYQACPPLEPPSLEISVEEVAVGLSDRVTYEVTVEWAVSGGCEPIRGILTREYLDLPWDPEVVNSIWSRAGSLLDEQWCRDGKRHLVEYVLTLRDAANQRETVKATQRIPSAKCPVVTPGHE
jgi:hypothetical protein